MPQKVIVILFVRWLSLKKLSRLESRYFKKNHCAKEVYCMQIQISFEKYEPVDLCLLFSVIYLFILLIWSKPWTKLYKTSVKKKYM